MGGFLRYLPGVNQSSMKSLWTSNTRVMRVTEEGFEATTVIPGNITPQELTDSEIKNIRDRVYDYVAKNRYKWFGENESCEITNEIY